MRTATKVLIVLGLIFILAGYWIAGLVTLFFAIAVERSHRQNQSARRY